MDRKTKTLWVIAAAFWLLLGRGDWAQAGATVYVVAHNYTAAVPDILGQVDVTTGAFTQIGDVSTLPYSIFGMGFGSNGQLYGLGFDLNQSFGPGELFRINTATGATTDLGALTFSPGGAAGAPNGTQYALDLERSGVSSTLYSVDPLSNTSIPIATVPFVTDGLVAIDSHGNLFTSANGGSLYEINTTNGAYQLIGDTGQGVSLFAGTFVGSNLYGFESTNAIVTINTSNAATIPVATMNLPSGYNVVAAVTAASVPEPASLVLGLIAGLSLLAYDLRRRQV